MKTPQCTSDNKMFRHAVEFNSENFSVVVLRLTDIRRNTNKKCTFGDPARKKWLVQYSNNKENEVKISKKNAVFNLVF